MTNPNDPIVGNPKRDAGMDYGLTKREYFAAMMMQGLINCEDGGTVLSAEKELGIPKGTYNYHIHWPMILARRACVYADALISEMNKAKP